jgi:hypothetical protein
MQPQQQQPKQQQQQQQQALCPPRANPLMKPPVHLQSIVGGCVSL